MYFYFFILYEPAMTTTKLPLVWIELNNARTTKTMRS